MNNFFFFIIFYIDLGKLLLLAHCKNKVFIYFDYFRSEFKKISKSSFNAHFFKIKNLKKLYKIRIITLMDYCFIIMSCVTFVLVLGRPYFLYRIMHIYAVWIGAILILKIKWFKSKWKLWWFGEGHMQVLIQMALTMILSLTISINILKLGIIRSPLCVV